MACQPVPVRSHFPESMLSSVSTTHSHLWFRIFSWFHLWSWRAQKPLKFPKSDSAQPFWCCLGSKRWQRALQTTCFDKVQRWYYNSWLRLEKLAHLKWRLRFAQHGLGYPDFVYVCRNIPINTSIVLILRPVQFNTTEKVHVSLHLQLSRTTLKSRIMCS